MKVKSIINTKKLVKGAIYDVFRLKNLDPNNISSSKAVYFRPVIVIKLNGEVRFESTINNFRTLDDKPLPKINWESEEYHRHLHLIEQCQINSKNISVGDYVVYSSNHHKSLINGKIYKISNLNIETKESRWNKWEEIDIQLEGSTRFYKSFSFRKCTVDETRDILIGSILNQESKVEKLDTSIRKIDKMSEEDRKLVLSKFLMSAITDTNRNNLGILDWTIKKVGLTYRLQESDFEEILKMDFGSVMKLFENKN